MQKLLESKEVYNVAVGDRTTLNYLFLSLRSALSDNGKKYESESTYRGYRAGDVRHSHADINKDASKLGYAPEYRIMDGLAKAMPWYIANVGQRCIASGGVKSFLSRFRRYFDLRVKPWFFF